MKNLLAAACLVLSLHGGGCVDKLSLEGRACPCLDGWRCCGGGECVPVDQSCPGCDDLVCGGGEQCYQGACAPCDRNNACGPDCTNCMAQDLDFACGQDQCGCRDEADCPGGMDCRSGHCASTGYDGGTEEDGGMDAGTTDGGISDAGTDGGPPDGGQGDDGDAGDDDINPDCLNNKNCGPACQDCTQLDGNWACLGTHCGCLDDADCQPDQACQNGTCIR